MRRQTGRLVGTSRPPHAVLRIGYGWPVASSPRRPVDELVVPGPSAPVDASPGPFRTADEPPATPVEPATAVEPATEVGAAAGGDPHDRSQLW
jgi:hypothetical protein